MTSVTMVPDDVGQQRLRIDNEKPAATQEVAGIVPSRPVEKNRSPDEKIQPIRAERRRIKDRRKGERRTSNRSILLDTRSHRERRTNTGNRQQDVQHRPRRIDIKV